MINKKKILCPVDFSETSKEAFEYAKTFAELFGAELTLLHVVPSVAEAYTALMPGFPVYGPETEKDVKEDFNEFTHDWSGKVEKVIRPGTASLEIIEFAQEEKFDLIIQGSKGRSKLERLLLGATGEKVIRKAQCPVLTVHQKPNALPIRRILLPTDFSEHSYAVIPFVAAIAQKFKAEVYILHVVEIGQTFDKEKQKEEYDYFEQVKQKLFDEWEIPTEFDTLVTQKFIRHHVESAGYGILEFAQDFDIDLITMATHGRSGLSHVLLGSTTEKLVKISHCPVLSIKSRF